MFIPENVPAQPTISAVSSASSASSFVMLSRRSSSQETAEDSDDEILYSVSEGSFSSLDGDLASDDDFVVLSRPGGPTGLSTPNGGRDDRVHTPIIERLMSELKGLSVEGSGPADSISSTEVLTTPIVVGAGVKKRHNKKVPSLPAAAAASYPSPAPSPARTKRVASPLVPAKSKAKAAVKSKPKKDVATGLGARSIVDDASERFSESGDTELGTSTGPSMYEEAVGYITSFLSNPAARENTACRLTLLQALIIELGLASSSLPASLTSAKAFLKSRAFLNVREYLAVREQGPAAVQRIMHPSRNALIKDIKKNRNKAPLGWVKESGLQVLLVQCHH